MGENSIRLRYSGFIVFVAKVLSIFTGLLFQLMIVRVITPEDYGVWFNVNDVVAYFTIFAGVFPFWALRFTARSKAGAVKTCFAANSVVASIAALIYLSLTPVVTSLLKVDVKYFAVYVLAVVYLVEVYLLNSLESCLQALKPHTLGYGLLLSEACKLVAAFALIVFGRLSLMGAIVSVTLGVAVQLIYYLKLLVYKLRERVRWSYVREWLKGSIANIYNIIGGQLASSIFIMLFIYGGEAARGYYGAAAQIASVITYSSFLAFALYPKLLAEGERQDVATSLRTVLMFAIPMTGGIIAIPESYMIVLKSEYAEAWPILIVLALDSLILTINAVLSYALYGLEKIDERAQIPLKKLVKSKLFTAFSLPYIHAAITLPTAYLTLSTYSGENPIHAALKISIINTIARSLTLIILYRMVHNATIIGISWKTVGKYVAASIIMALILHFGLIPHPRRIYQILTMAMLGGVIYMGILLTIEPEARRLTERIWKEAISKITSMHSRVH